MDPNATLKELRMLVSELQASEDEFAQRQEEMQDGSADDLLPHFEEVAEVAHRMSELVEALDGWLSKGGFLPKDWRPAATSLHTKEGR